MSDLKKITKQELIDALKSGKYKKARGKLHRPEKNSFCCLGVACELMGVKWGDGIFPSDGTIPPHIREQYAEFISHNVQRKLISRNDNNGGFEKAIEFLEAMP